MHSVPLSEFLIRIKDSLAAGESMATVYNPLSLNDLVERSEPSFLKTMPTRIKSDLFKNIDDHISDGGDWDVELMTSLKNI